LTSIPSPAGAGRGNRGQTTLNIKKSIIPVPASLEYIVAENKNPAIFSLSHHALHVKHAGRRNYRIYILNDYS
jgi:hypothetical protein